MKRFLIIAGIGVAVAILLVWAKNSMDKNQTKSLSPEETVAYEDDELKIDVFYNRPFKKGREIFGGLVPYGKVWRTGANEATTFETKTPLRVKGKLLKAGKYSLWTIPNEHSWSIIFNAEYGQWGVNPAGEPNRNPEKDVLMVEVHAAQHEKEFEQFTITFEKMGADPEMILLWDKTVVVIPFSH
jgi:hypothetical protein